MQPITLSKTQHQALLYVLKGASTDPDRPVLTGVNSLPDHIEAASGFVIHAAKMPLPKQGLFPFSKTSLEDKSVKDKPQFVHLTEAEPIWGSYPDVSLILPSREPDFQLAVNPKLLIDALTGLTAPVIISIWKDNNGKVTQAFSVQGIIRAPDEDIPAYALIMPMWRDENVDPRLEAILISNTETGPT